MQGYRRKIAYLYSYEDGRQSSSAGFVKLEMRGDRCRLEIHLKGGGRLEGGGKAYIYFPRRKRIVGIYLGELEEQNGRLEWQGTVDSDNIQGKKVHISETGGIWIRDLNSREYVAEWDDEPVDVSRFILYPEGGEKCIGCPKFGSCERSREDASDRRGNIYEGSSPSGT